jgi:hypothetical protein
MTKPNPCRPHRGGPFGKVNGNYKHGRYARSRRVREQEAAEYERAEAWCRAQPKTDWGAILRKIEADLLRAAGED